MIISLLVTSPVFTSSSTCWALSGRPTPWKWKTWREKEQFTSVSSPQTAFTALRISHHTLLDTMWRYLEELLFATLIKSTKAWSGPWRVCGVLVWFWLLQLQTRVPKKEEKTHQRSRTGTNAAVLITQTHHCDGVCIVAWRDWQICSVSFALGGEDDFTPRRENKKKCGHSLNDLHNDVNLTAPTIFWTIRHCAAHPAKLSGWEDRRAAETCAEQKDKMLVLEKLEPTYSQLKCSS